MEQLILHLIGDFIIQTDRMATEKTSKSTMALLHALVYSSLFILITTSPLALFVIFSTHFFIDRFRLARYVVFGFNWMHDRKLKWIDCSSTGYHEDRPVWLAVWLLIIADNTIHITINYLAIAYL